jgi:hypothetical protein
MLGIPAEAVFVACNAAVVPAWLALAVAPGWSGTHRLVHSMLYPLALGALYAVGMATLGLLYLTLRGVLRREASLDEAAA